MPGWAGYLQEAKWHVGGRAGQSLGVEQEVVSLYRAAKLATHATTRVQTFLALHQLGDK